MKAVELLLLLLRLVAALFKRRDRQQFEEEQRDVEEDHDAYLRRKYGGLRDYGSVSTDDSDVRRDAADGDARQDPDQR